MLVRTGPKGLRLAAMDEAARSSGLVIGERLTDARAKVPALASSVIDDQADLACLLRLARWAERWSPWIALDAPDGLMLDITGIPHLFGGEEPMLADITTRFGHIGFTTLPGLAGTRKAAWALARFAADAPVAREGMERRALKSLPVEALGLDPDLCHILRRLGLKTIGQFYDIPRAALSRRFRSAKTKTAIPAATSDEILAELDRALGVAEHPLDPLTHPPVFAVRRTLMEPLISNAGIETIIETLSQELSRQLHLAGHGALHITCKLYRTDASRITLPAGLARPSRDARHLARLFEFRLDTIDAGFGIDAATLEANETAPLDLTQASLAPGSSLPATAALAELADRIANRPDGAQLHRLTTVESHMPERAQAETPAGFAESPEAHFIPAPAEATGASPARPITLLERPESVDVIATVPDGPPVRFTWRRLARRIVRAEGPERITPQWWHPDTPKRPRDYYIVEDETGRRYWLYREGLYGDAMSTDPKWYIHGLFA